MEVWMIWLLSSLVVDDSEVSGLDELQMMSAKQHEFINPTMTFAGLKQVMVSHSSSYALTVLNSGLILQHVYSEMLVY